VRHARREKRLKEVGLEKKCSRAAELEALKRNVRNTQISEWNVVVVGTRWKCSFKGKKKPKHGEGCRP